MLSSGGALSRLGGGAAQLRSAAAKFFAGLAITALLVGPLTYGAYGAPGLDVGLLLALSIFAFMVCVRIYLAHSWSGFRLSEALAAGLAPGLAAGLTVGLAGEPIRDPLVAVAAGVGAGLARPLGTTNRRPHRAWPLWEALLNGTIAVAIGVYADIVDHDVRFGEALGSMAGLGSVVVAATLGLAIGLALRPALAAFGGAWPYLARMAAPASGFLVGYVALAVWFAAMFRALCQIHASGMSASAPLNRDCLSISFLDLVYFSVATLATVGYGDITPNSPEARALAMAEILAGVIWTVVVFAAILAYLGPVFAEIGQRRPGAGLPAVATPPAADARRPRPEAEDAEPAGAGATRA
jgi:hypothetical protein